jgi:hypothetical protein
MDEQLKSLLDYCAENQRICPQPKKWNELWELLPNRVRNGSGWEPALPLILAAWYDTPAMLKMLRLREHIEWAKSHEALDLIDKFLRDLPETEWYHSYD